MRGSGAKTWLVFDVPGKLTFKRLRRPNSPVLRSPYHDDDLGSHGKAKMDAISSGLKMEVRKQM